MKHQYEFVTNISVAVTEKSEQIRSGSLQGFTRIEHTLVN